MRHFCWQDPDLSDEENEERAQDYEDDLALRMKQEEDSLEQYFEGK